MDVSALEGAIDALSDDADAGAFAFRTETAWEDALWSVTTVDEFDQAGETVRTREFTLQSHELFGVGSCFCHRASPCDAVPPACFNPLSI